MQTCYAAHHAMNPAMADKARQAAATVLGDLEGVLAVLIATADGVPLAHVGGWPPDDARLAAASGGLVAFTEALVAAGPVGQWGCLFIEAAAGRVLVRRLRVAGVNLVALLFADKFLSFSLAASRFDHIEIAMGSG